MTTFEPPHSTSMPIRRVESGWTGWIGFAATMLILVGLFQVTFGFVALFKDDYFVVPKGDLIVSVNYTAWGFLHIMLGLVAFAVAAGMFSGSLWARILGVFLAVVSTLTNLAFLNASPLWCTLIISFNVLLIWALTVHGDEMKDLA